MITAVLQFSASEILLNSILSSVTALTPITHLILIDLDYPANLNHFYSYLFPLISFDLIETDEIYERIFSLSEFEDEPQSEPFDLLGYSYQLAINNIGSLLIFIFSQPILLITLTVVSKTCCIFR